jgi:hypothetical protein
LSAAGRSTPKFLAKARVTVGELILASRLVMLVAASSLVPAPPGDFEGGGQIGHGAKAGLAQRLGLRGEAGK